MSGTKLSMSTVCIEIAQTASAARCGGHGCHAPGAPWGTDLAKVCGRHCRRRKWPSSSAKRPIQQNGSIDQPPTVRITGRHRPDRGTIGGSGANRDYRMSTYELCTPARVTFLHAEMRNARVHKFFPVSLVSHRLPIPMPLFDRHTATRPILATVPLSFNTTRAVLTDLASTSARK